MEAQPSPNDGMTADTAPGQNEENAQTPNAATASSGTAAHSTASVGNRAQTFIDALHALEKGDDAQASAQSLAQHFADNATLTNAALELAARKVEGREAIATFWQEYKATLGESFSEFSHVMEDADSAGLFWTTQSDGATKYHGATLLQFDANGQIEFFRGYYDTRELDVEK